MTHPARECPECDAERVVSAREAQAVFARGPAGEPDPVTALEAVDATHVCTNCYHTMDR